MSKVVQLPKHTLIQGDDMELKFGNTTVVIDYSYINSRTPEQAKQDKEALSDALWEIEEIGESA